MYFDFKYSYKNLINITREIKNFLTIVGLRMIKRTKQPRENNLDFVRIPTPVEQIKPRKRLSCMQISCIPVLSKLRFSYNFLQRALAD